MRKQQKLPVVENKVLILPNTEIKLGSDSWYQWLENAQSFRYIPISEDTELFAITVRARITQNNIYWNAFKKVKGELRNEYVGLSDDMNFEKLQFFSEKLSLSQNAYEEYKKSKLDIKRLTASDELEMLRNKIKSIAKKIKNNEPGYIRNSAQKLMQDILDLAEDV